MELKSKEGEQQLDSLLQLARNSMEEVRLYLHQLDLSQESLPLATTLQQLTEEFKKHAKVNVRTRIIGRVYSSKQSKNDTISELAGITNKCCSTWAFHRNHCVTSF